MLRPTLTSTEGAAGSTYRTITYTNIGRWSCVVNGFPAVMFVGPRGRPLGAPAVQTGGPAKAVTLAPGGKAKFVVRAINAGIQTGCQTPSTYTRATGLRIVPPGSGRPTIVPISGANACRSRSVQQLSVGPVTP
jgi:hypothetical protein